MWRRDNHVYRWIPWSRTKYRSRRDGVWSELHLTVEEPNVDIDAELEIYDENGNIDYLDYEDYYYCMSRDNYDLRKMTK